MCKSLQHEYKKFSITYSQRKGKNMTCNVLRCRLNYKTGLDNISSIPIEIWCFGSEWSSHVYASQEFLVQNCFMPGIIYLLASVSRYRFIIFVYLRSLIRFTRLILTLCNNLYMYIPAERSIKNICTSHSFADTT